MSASVSVVIFISSIPVFSYTALNHFAFILVVVSTPVVRRQLSSIFYYFVVFVKSTVL